jgi:tetratricopeptide (TPR) repeat protein
MSRGQTTTRRWLPFVAFAALLAVAWLAYWPGRNGAFLFDDFSNLAPLGDYGRIDTWWKVVAFLTSGFAGPTGRPLALATFLLDARDWPASPEAFKLTNVAIHLLNGALLAGLLAALSRALGVDARRAAWAGVLAAGLWLLNPLWVSTTLYVVQRMAMLAATFVFAGLWGYAHGRALLASGRRRAGFAWMTGSLTLGTLLAVLSKENGALLPLLAWVLEALVFDRDHTALEQGGRAFLVWRWVFIRLPALAVLGYLATFLPGLWTGATAGREFTPLQRLLTESRIVWGYLGDIWLARPHDGGLFHDDIRLSTGLLHPPSTLFAVLGILALIAFAALSRWARRPVVAAAGVAVGFYLAGQIMESTWLQLELAFEHRNYLPAALMFWPLALALTGVRSSSTASPGGRAARPGPAPWKVWLAVALLASFALQTARRADVWGKPFQQALVWAREHPDSPRAQSYLAGFWSAVGNLPESARLLDAALRKHPHSLILLINRAGVACAQGQAPAWLRAGLLHAARTAPLADNVTQYQFGKLLDAMDNCTAFGPGFAQDLIAAALANPHAAQPTVQRDLLHRKALVALAAGQVQTAYALDLQSLRLPDPPVGARLRFAVELASAGHPQHALDLLDAVPSPLAHIHGWNMAALHQRWLAHVGFYQESEAHLRKVLAAEIAAKRRGDAAQ